jgi:cyclase
VLKRRLIPVLFLQQGHMVRSELFRIHNIIGNPMVHVERMVEWDVDELIIIDVSEGPHVKYDIYRDDYRQAGAKDLLEFIHRASSDCRIPLTIGGRIRTLEDIRVRILNGADKVTVNTLLREAPDIVTEAAHMFGSQAIIASIDYRMVDGDAHVHVDHGRTAIGTHPAAWAKRAEELGAGEILLNAIDRDGTAQGYDLATIREVAAAVTIPVIACGGAGHQSHFAKCFEETDASGVAAGNIFHFTENAYPRAKKMLRTRNIAIR